jgi:FKBP-type peptidyl-prolyl cis-trans isomerase FklB
MKIVKVCFLSMSLMGVAFVSCSNGLNARSSEADSVSYAFGINIGESLKKSKIEGLNAGIIAKGISDVLENEGANAKLTYEESLNMLQDYFQKVQNQTADKNAQAGTEFLASNKSAEGVVTLESGLQYKITSAGTGPKPAAGDKVKVHYKGTLLNGEVFDSSIERGEPVEFQLDRVIRGWTEGLQQVNEGSKVILYVPSDLAYGPQGAGERIGPNSTLIFEIELIQVTKAEAPKPAKK